MQRVPLLDKNAQVTASLVYRNGHGQRYLRCSAARAARRASRTGRGRRLVDLGRCRLTIAAPCRARRQACSAPGLRTSASCSTTCRSSASGWARRPLGGDVVVGGNPNHRGDELASDISHTECRLVVTDSAHLPLIEGLDLGQAIGRPGRDNPRVLVIDHAGVRQQLQAHDADRLTENPKIICVDVSGYLIFTSGTSGAPKAVRCSQGRMAFIGTAIIGHVRPRYRGCLLRRDATVPLERTDGRLGARPRRRSHRRPSVAWPVLCIRIPPGYPAIWSHVLQLRREALSYILATPEHPMTRTRLCVRSSGTRRQRPTSNVSL